MFDLFTNYVYPNAEAENNKFVISNSVSNVLAYQVSGGTSIFTGYNPHDAENGKFFVLSASSSLSAYNGSLGYKYAMLVFPVSTVDFTYGYAPAEAERGKFVKIDNSTFAGYSGRDKYAVLTYSIPLSDCDLTYVYNPAEAERGKFVKVNDSQFLGYAALSARGKYAILTTSVSTVSPTDPNMGYAQAAAENQKFVRIKDTAPLLSTYLPLSATSRGKYAMRVWNG